MSFQPLVSVITPTYNQEKYIIDCIKSVQNQTFSNWEMFIVNDGSTDNTSRLVEEYISNDLRITLFNQENVGIFRLAETYNFALSKAKGKYIAILEGDDLWNADRLENQIKIMEENKKIVLTWGRVLFVKHDDLNSIYKTHPEKVLENVKYYNNSPIGSILNLMYFENCMPPLSFLIRKENLLKIGGFIQDHGLPLLDFPTILALGQEGEFYFEEKILGKQRIYMTSVTKTHSVLAIKNYYQAAIDHYDQLNEAIKKCLIIKKEDIDKYYQLHIHITYACSGRYKLIRKDFKGARQDYIKAIFYPGIANLLWRLRALIGYVMSLFRLNVEWIAKILGKTNYQ